MINTVIGIFLSLFFLLLALITLFLPWSPTVRTEIVDFLLSNTLALTLIGFAFLMIAIGFIFQLVHGFKRRYISFQEGALKTDISEQAVDDYLKGYFQDLFPYSEVPCQLTLKKKKAHIVADLPYVKPAEQKSLVEKIEKDLSEIFRDFLGYRKELLVSISFAPENKLI